MIGTGEYDPEPTLAICPKCKNSPDLVDDCQECEGTGEVEVEVEPPDEFDEWLDRQARRMA